MIIFNDWNISLADTLIARQYDNKTRELYVTGDLPEGWIWTILVSAKGHLDILSLSKDNNGYSVLLTAQMLAYAGNYTIQLKGTKGDLVRHTNKIIVMIPPSLSGDANWPTIPSEFTQIEEKIYASASLYPKIGENGNWQTWNAIEKAWIDTGVKAQGVKGNDGISASISIGTVTTGDADTPAKVENVGTKTAAVFNFTIPKGEKGDKGNKGDMGEPGSKGDKGDTGAAGSPGAKGDKGDPFTYADFTEEQLAALKGEKGDKGDKGAQGEKGKAFTYEDFTEAQLAALKGPKGDQGDKGSQGEKGTPGAAATITIGTVTTGAPSTDASVENAGTSAAATLNFTIPRGAKGDKGDPGSPGAKGDPYTLTDADKQTITNAVLAALPTWTGGDF